MLTPQLELLLVGCTRPVRRNSRNLSQARYNITFDVMLTRGPFAIVVEGNVRSSHLSISH